MSVHEVISHLYVVKPHNAKICICSFGTHIIARYMHVATIQVVADSNWSYLQSSHLFHHIYHCVF